MRPNTLRLLTAAATLFAAVQLQAQFATNWVAFNDHNLSGFPTTGTATNRVSLYHLGGLASGGGPGGPLTNYLTGDPLAATLIVTWTGGDGPDNFGASADADAGSPAANLFDGIVDVGGVATGDGGDEGIIGLRASEMNVVSLTFSNLDVSQRYLFRGTAVRGGSGANLYPDRWAVYTIQGAASYVDAHEDASANQNIITGTTYPASGLADGQVALNSGYNRQGSLVGWNDIVPAPDGTFTIIEQQYTGTAPFGNPAGGPYGYGMNAIMLAEVFSGPPQPATITAQPIGATNEEGRVVFLRVVATGTPPLNYQWYKGIAPGGMPLPGATRPVLSVTNIAGSGKGWSVPGDSGDYYVAVSGSIGDPVTSSTVKVLVHADTNAPVFLYATCSSTNPNLITLTLSEPLDDSDNRVSDELNWLAESADGGLDLGVLDVTYIGGSNTIDFITANARDPNGSYRIRYNNSFQPLIDRSQAQNAMPADSSILISCIETELLPLTASWRYLDNDIDPGPTWFEIGFADGSWPTGPGVFDAKRAATVGEANCRATTLYNLGDVGTCINLESPVTITNLIAAYFRTHFNFGGNPATTLLQLNGKVDDGAIIYLNGAELLRIGVPAAPVVIDHTTLASRGVGDGDAQDVSLFIYPSQLRSGDNVLAVGLHQQNLTSSDLTMGLRVTSLTRVPIPTAGPRLTITLEGTNVRIRWDPANGVLQYSNEIFPTSWNDQTTGQVGPAEYLIPRTEAHRFYSLRQ